MKKIDELVKRVEFFERLAVYGDRKSFLQRIAQDASFREDSNVPWEGGSSQSPATPSDGVMNMPADHITGLRPIDPKVQGMLNDILVPTGDIFMLKLDGRIGDNTKEALRKFKEKYGPASVANITKVHNEQSGESAVAKKDPSSPLPAGSNNLSQIGNTRATPGAGSSGTERKVPGPKA